MFQLHLILLKILLVVVKLSQSYTLLNNNDYTLKLRGNSYNIQDAGDPLFLSPLIESGRIQEAQQLSRVKPLAGDVISYSGFLTVNKEFDSNLFFWFFPSETDWNKSPVAIWLQGGPGYSGLYGLFNELGPFTIGKKTIKLRKYSWHRKSNLIFIDSPVGSGYSFTKSLSGYARNQTAVGKDLYTAMVQFFQLFPNLQSNPFYITGESYAGKYIPALGYAIHKYNPTSQIKINLQGLFIGNGLTDPVNMIPKYSEQLYALGFIDYNERIEFNKHEQSIVKAIENEDWDTATVLYTQLIIGYSFFPYPTLFNNVTGIESYYNFVNENSAKWLPFENDFVVSNYFRRLIHVGNLTRDSGSLTEKLFKSDITKSVIHLVEELIERYRIMFYNGQLDIICAYPLTENFLRKMKWSGSANYKTSKRHIWKVGNDIAGYVKEAGKLSDVLVRNAGHMVPTDQPKWAFELFNKFIYKIPLY
ncbi:venom serine carboxypeptidase-like [Lycorma delicatula]|uniref:venom serine carboxypeptidase-like n=1 Tax=Lycorma delicatula TaxID=130591 RepID=UPI003F510CC2